MILTFAEDFTSDVSLDSELKGTPLSGLYWNRGVHPKLTVDNLLTFLPKKTITFAAYAAGTTYGVFNTSRKRSDIVTYEDKVYQSKVADNVGNTPATPSDYWLETDINSLRIKSFIWSVEDNALSALALNRMLIENQYIYNLGESLTTIRNDFFGWAFEPKGSDYVTIRINQISFQANKSTAQSLYVINQGRLIETLTLNPNDGLLEFEDIGYLISGKGPFYFIVEGQEVLSDGAYNDPLRYKGFVTYPVIGTGATAAEAEYSYSSSSNGLNFNVSCYLDSSLYVENNKVDLAKFYQSQFEYDFIRMSLHDSNNRFNQEERIQSSNPELLAAESLDLKSATVVKNYTAQLKRAAEAVNRTFDKFLVKKKGLKVKRRVYT